MTCYTNMPKIYQYFFLEITKIVFHVEILFIKMYSYL